MIAEAVFTPRIGTLSADESTEARVPLRNEPVQARSTARLTALLDAAASVIDEIGFERLTTAMVAHKAGASIGTVYRYFPDRLVLLQALGARNLDRVLAVLLTELRSPDHSSWQEAVDGAFDAFVDACRTEPGFRGLRVGDVIDLRPGVGERPFSSLLADRMFDVLVDRFQIPDTADVRLRFETAMLITDAVASRAFARDPQGDEAFLELGRQIVGETLAVALATSTR